VLSALISRLARSLDADTLPEAHLAVDARLAH